MYSLDQDDIAQRLLKLQLSTGYNIVQKNGQRIYGGPPPGWTGPPPDNGTEIYCYKIPRDCFEDELVPVFAQVGKIYELRLMVEFSGTNRSYCYVRYTTPNDARQAIRSLNNYLLRPGFRLAVTRSVDNRKLCINTDATLSSDMEKLVGDELGKVVEGVNRVHFMSGGWLQVEFSTHRLAALARRQLVPGSMALFNSVAVKEVDWADPEVSTEMNTEVREIGGKELISTEKEIRSKEMDRIGLSDIVQDMKEMFVALKHEEDVIIAINNGEKDLVDEGQNMLPSLPNYRRVDRGGDDRGPISLPCVPNLVEELHKLCVSQGWGAPQYSLTGIRYDEVVGQEVYQCTVTVPAVPHSQEISNWSLDRHLARVNAATKAMQSIVRSSIQMLYTQCQEPSPQIARGTVGNKQVGTSRLNQGTTSLCTQILIPPTANQFSVPPPNMPRVRHYPFSYQAIPQVQFGNSDPIMAASPENMSGLSK